MKTIYQENPKGYIQHNNTHIVMLDSNRDYISILEEVANDTAILYPYEGSSEEILDNYNKSFLDANVLVEAHIQKVVDAYNVAHGLIFKDAHSCADYTLTPYYSHYEFCVDVWEFSVDVWETVRGIQADIASGMIPLPTIEELEGMLPVYEGVI